MGDEIEQITEYYHELQARELRRLLGLLLDRVVVPGHSLTAEDWEQACRLSGRYLPRYLAGQPTLDPEHPPADDDA